MFGRRLARALSGAGHAAPQADPPEAGLARRFEELRVVHRLTEAVTRAETPESIYEAALEALVRLLRVDRAAILLWDGDGVLRFKASRGLSEAYRAAVTGHSPWAPTEVGAQPILVEDAVLEPSLAAFRATILGEGIRALGFVPVVGQGRLLGKFMLYFDRVHRFAPDEVEVAKTVAHHIGFALERMRRDAELRAANEQLVLIGLRERRLAEEARAAEQRAAFLAEASRVLAGSLDFEATLRSVGDLLIPRVADWYALYLRPDDDRLEPVAVSHRDPARVALAWEIYRRFPPRLDQGDDPVVSVIRTGRSVLSTAVSDEFLRALARDAWHLESLRALGLRAYLVVPLTARGRIIGALGSAMAESGRPYGPADLAFAEDLGQRIAAALENARLFRQAQQAIREAMAATEARDAFLARASHELRTPLTSALVTVRLLARVMSGTLREPPDTLLEIASRNLDTVLRLVNDLLDASKLAAEPRLEAAPVDLWRAAAESAGVVEPQARDKGVRIEVLVPSGLTVAGDQGKLEQLFVNLLANAVQHSPAGGTVVVDAVPDGAVWHVRVRDEGEGIAAEDLERIFHPFVRAGGSTRQRKGGTGLGLAICRQIVALHRGRVWAESAGPGMGSTFTVSLPAAQPVGATAA